MKKLIMLLAIGTCFAQAKAQDTKMEDIRSSQVPGAINTSFASAYPDAKDVEWNKEGNYYVAEYDDPRSHHDAYVVYDNMGKLVEKRERVKKHDLPASIISYLQNKYDEDEMHRAYKVTDSNGTVSYKGRVKGNTLYFDGNGNLLKQENKL